MRSGTAVLWILAFLPALTVDARENLLRDPGFEQYHYDEERGYYVPNDRRAAWKEITLGRASVRFDASSWAAPEAMVAERPLGFTPGARGFEGYGEEENSGRLILQQDIVNMRAFLAAERYEAWFWLGGAGNDDDSGADLKDEDAAWEIWFYGTIDASQWNEDNALEYHHASRSFSGAPRSFERVAGYGFVPSGAVGCRMRIWASTWSSAAGGAAYDTEVAVDNAHFALMDQTNLLVNGDFELDVSPGDFTGWDRPAAWGFPQTTLPPLDLDNIYGENFDHGTFRPFFGFQRVYGSETWLSGWVDDAFTFSQEIDYAEPAGRELVLMFYWFQDIKSPSLRYELRRQPGDVDVVLEYFAGEERLRVDEFDADWPNPSNEANRCQYDQNAGRPYNPRFRVLPPDGTDRIVVSVSVATHTQPPLPELFGHGVDDFYLGVAEVQPVVREAPSSFEIR